MDKQAKTRRKRTSRRPTQKSTRVNKSRLSNLATIALLSAAASAQKPPMTGWEPVVSRRNPHSISRQRILSQFPPALYPLHVGPYVIPDEEKAACHASFRKHFHTCENEGIHSAVDAERRVQFRAKMDALWAERNPWSDANYATTLSKLAVGWTALIETASRLDPDFY